MVLHIRDTRSRHEHIVPLPNPALDALRAYRKDDLRRALLATSWVVYAKVAESSATTMTGS